MANQMDVLTATILSVVVFSLGLIVPCISLVQGIGKRAQVDLLNTLSDFPVSKSAYYKIAKNYFVNLAPFSLTAGYFIPILILVAITWGCAATTYFGATWTSYLNTPNFVLGGACIYSKDCLDHSLSTYQMATLSTGCMAFIGAYVYIMAVLLNRINNGDLAPITYYYFAVRLLVATLVAAVVRHFAYFMWPSDVSPKILVLVGFAVGFQPDLWITSLVTRIERRFGLGRDQKDPKEEVIPGNLSLKLIQGLTSAKRDRLEELDLDNCQAIAAHNPFLIWARTSFQLCQIIDWMAQAQLVALVMEERIKDIRTLHIRDVFALNAALSGESKSDIAKALNISEALASDLQKYLERCPAFNRLKEVSDLLAETVDGAVPEPRQINQPNIVPHLELVAQPGM